MPAVGSGFPRQSDRDPRFASSAGGMTVTTPILIPNGTVGAPAIAFSGDPDTGLYSPGINYMALALNGTAHLSFAPGIVSASGTTDLRTEKGAFTSGSLTLNYAGRVGTTLSRYTWTNAMVVALGAGLTGDLTVGTLAAGGVVCNAYIIITGAATGPATLTVSLGKTAGGAEYVAAGDAKAAANTVYGNVIGERGASLTGYDLPSWSATTALTLRFTSTGGNLDTVLSSTGTVVLETLNLA